MKRLLCALLGLFIALPSMAAETLCNLYDKSTGVVYGYPTSSYTWQEKTSVSSELSIMVRLTPGETYTAQRIPGANTIFRIQASASQTLTAGQSLTNIDSTGLDAVNVKTFTVPNNAPYVIFYVRNVYNSNPTENTSDLTINDIINGFMVVKGSTAPSEYIPYDANCGVSNIGCNLFNKDDSHMILNGYIDATLVRIGTQYDNYRSAIIKVQPNTTYTIQRYIGEPSNIHNRMRIGDTTSFPQVEGPVQNVQFYDNSTTRTATHTTSADAQYMIVYGMTNAASATDRANFFNALKIEEGSTATDYVAYSAGCRPNCRAYTSATGTVTQNPDPTATNPVEPVFYQQGNIVLRKVGDYKDTYDATTGIITRKIGEYTLTGQETGFRIIGSGICTYPISGLLANTPIMSTHFKQSSRSMETLAYNEIRTHTTTDTHFYFKPDREFTDANDCKDWLAAQYSAGTPVKIYYIAKTERTEYIGMEWCEGIKIATTKYNTTAFSGVVTALNTAIDKIKDVVSNTIAQTTAVANLQSGKQTMPDSTATNGTCPNYKQCLLVEDNNGTPHWYVITDPFRDFVAPIVATNAAATSNTSQVASSLPAGYTELSYIETTGGQWIDTGLTQLFGADAFTITTSVATTNLNYGSLLGNKGTAANADGLGLYINTPNANNILFSHHAPEKTLNVGSLNFYNGQFHTLTAYYDGNGKGGYVIDGTTLQTTGVNTASVDNSGFRYYILKNGQNLAFVGKVKTINIVAGGVERFNFVPAKRNSDGVIGMYDTVGNVFYTNAGSGTLRGGDELHMKHTWTVRWNNNGDGVGVTVNGIAKCNNSSSDATNTASGGACWCKATDLIVNSESIANDSAPWAFYRSYSGTECNSACANACGYTVRNNATFRRTVFGQ